MLKHALLALLCGAIVMTVGCATFNPTDPRDDLAASELAFFGALVTLDQFVAADAIDEDEAKTIVPIIEAIQASLKAAHAAIDDGSIVEAAQYAELARQKVRELSSILRQKKEASPLVATPLGG